MGDPSSENVRLGFYFTDLIFVVCQSTVKTAKIGSLENFRLYGIYKDYDVERATSSKPPGLPI